MSREKGGSTHISLGMLSNHGHLNIISSTPALSDYHSEGGEGGTRVAESQMQL